MKSRLLLMVGVMTYMSMVLFFSWSLSTSALQLHHQTDRELDIIDSSSDYTRRQPYNPARSSKPRISESAPIPNEMPFSPTLVNGTDINANISKFFVMEPGEEKDDFVHLHHYKFNINSNVCTKGDLFLVMIVHSAPTNFIKRNLIRTTYGSVQSYKGKTMAVVFMLGAVQDTIIQEAINNESKRYGDIVQGNFQDAYISLIRKHIMDMHWFKLYCNADLILKLDDDTFVNPFRLVEYILKVQPKGVAIHCQLVLGGQAKRSTKIKWHVPISQYPFPIFPSFCRGYAYLTTPETWTAMYMASKTTRMLDMDDIYVTGILGLKIQVNQINFKDILYHCPQNKQIDIKRLNNKALFVPYVRCGLKVFMFWKEIPDLNTDV